MSKNSEKGRKGELAVTAIFSNIGVHESGIEVIRANTTTTPENGVAPKLAVHVEFASPHAANIGPLNPVRIAPVFVDPDDGIPVTLLELLSQIVSPLVTIPVYRAPLSISNANAITVLSP